MVNLYKFAYWFGFKFGVKRMEQWGYLNWFRVRATAGIMDYFLFTHEYFKFCDKHGISSKNW